MKVYIFSPESIFQSNFSTKNVFMFFNGEQKMAFKSN